MSLTPSKMLPLGTQVPAFKVIDTANRDQIEFDDISGPKGTVIAFICNHCPYVLHVIEEFVEVAKQYEEEGFGFLAISSNDAQAYPQDGPEQMKVFAIENRFNFPYAYDEDQSVAKAFDAACTPDFYVFDENAALAYRGRLDTSMPGNAATLDGADLRNALDRLLSGEAQAVEQFPSMGCNIKWK